MNKSSVVYGDKKAVRELLKQKEPKAVVKLINLVDPLFLHSDKTGPSHKLLPNGVVAVGSRGWLTHRLPEWHTDRGRARCRFPTRALVAGEASPEWAPKSRWSSSSLELSLQLAGGV